MNEERLIAAAQFVCESVDWTRPELATTEAAAACHAGRPLEAARAFVHYLRHRETPRLGYTRAYVAALRASATPEEVQAAADRWEKAHAEPLVVHHTAMYYHLGPEAFLLAATPDRCRLMAEKILEHHDRWDEGSWGVVHSVVDLIRFLLPLDDCSDADLVPFFAWLLTKTRKEWSEARRWSETTLGTSGHNWWAHTFLGFFTLGLFFPEFRGVERFRSLGLDYLDREVDILFYADGWSKEGAPGYSLFAAGNLLRWAYLAELNGLTVREPTRAKLRVMADAGWRLLTPDGGYPVFGDDTRSAAGFIARGQWSRRAAPAVPLETAALTQLRSFAAQFTLPEAKWVAQTLSPDWEPLYGVLASEGRDLYAAYHRVPAVPPPGPDTCLRDSGYYMMRQDWSRQADYLALVAGPLGERVTSHQHADRLSFELYARGRRILVDNWYGPSFNPDYDPQARMWRVGTAAHNTATVDGQDQVPVVAEFLLGATITPTVDDWRSERDFAYFSGVHEGYLHRLGVTAVRRKLFYLRGQYWIMLDRFTSPGEAEHEYQLHFHLNVPHTLAPDGRLVTHGEGGNLLLVPVPGMEGAAAVEPHPWPVKDYENPDHLTYTRRAVGNWMFGTLMIPFEGDTPPSVAVEVLPVQADEREVSSFEITALAVTLDGRRDVYLDQHMQWNLPWRTDAYTGEGRLFHSQVNL